LPREHGKVQLRGYLWPFDKYRDAAVGSELERAAAFRYNKRLARELPAYLNRWAMICCVLLTVAVATRGPVGAVIGTVFTLAFCMTLHIAHVYLLFRCS
jgi:hypothetical protein